MAIEAGDKIVKLDIVFKLPKSFDGDLNDAIAEILKYRRGPKDHQQDFKNDPDADVYTNWWNMVCTTDRVLFGTTWMGEYDGKIIIEKKISLDER